MTPLHHRTPYLRSQPLSEVLGAHVHLKLEALQPTGSFKLRGMGRACQEAVRDGARHLVSSSGGNAGLAVAWCARQLAVPATVVVPRRTAPRMRSLIEAEGAQVVVHGEVWDDAHAHAATVAADSGALVHPFDGEVVWRGHASLIAECAEQGERPGAVVVCVGGGGLLSGVVQGMHDVGWSDVPVVAVETHGAASYARALQAGTPVDIGGIDSIALTLGARTVCERSVRWAAEHPIRSWLCDDHAAVSACSRFLDDHRILVEPSCGAGLAAVYDRAPGLAESESVLVVVCGGASVTGAQLAEWQSSVYKT